MRKIIIWLWLAGIAHRIWQVIYPYTAKKKARDKALKRLLEGMVFEGALVFDIGANIGIYSEVFSSMKARVVAVEPDFDMAVKLFKKGLHVEWCAVGGKGDTVCFYRNEVGTLSTTSAEQMAATRFKGFKWKPPVLVRMTTAAALAERYGPPHFVKIDVEGGEIDVIHGIEKGPRALVFEFTPENIENLFYCICMLDALDDYKYRFTLGLEGDTEFECGWVDSRELLERISTIPDKTVYGDIWAKWSRECEGET